MSFWKKLLQVHCTRCQAVLDTKRHARGVVMMDDLGKSAYRCRACGVLACLDCAQASPCKKCGGRVFDVALR